VRYDSTTGKLVQNSGVTISDADLLTTTDLTVNDDTVLGSSNSDTVNFNARVASDINPATDDTYDLGVTGHEWRNLNIDGTANIDSLVADTADINGGTIDGTAIGATTPSTIAGTTLTTSSTVTINGGSTNSVAYLNSSKVLTTGSALTFDGTNLGVGNADATTVNNNNGSGTLVVGVNSGSTGMTILSGASSGNQARLTFANATTGAGSYSAQIGYVSGDNALVIYNANTERMRIDSSGNLLAGTTTNVNARLHLNYEGVNGATAPIGISLRTAESASTTAIQFVYTPGPDQIGTIAVTSTATAYNTSSDARLKTNIRDYSPGALIDSLQPRMFDWKSGEKDSIGFVAQELQAVYPQAVTAGDDGEEIERSWGVDFAKLVPLLVAEVKALRARVAQLESNA
jgi:hypothetical protein